MRILLDQGLPRSCARLLSSAGVDARHAGDCGLARATDSAILDFARQQDRIVVTLDSDFHALLALSGAVKPSVIRIRVEGLRGEAAAKLIRLALEQCQDDLTGGCVVSVESNRVRVRRLPVRSRAREQE